MGYKKDKSPAKLRLSASNFPDMRSRHASIHKIKESTKQSIIDHIESYYSSLSYYRRKNAPLRRYLPSGITVAEIESNYKEKHTNEKVRYESYRKIFVYENQFYKVRRRRKQIMERVQAP